MSPAPIQATTPARLRTMTRTRNRRRRTALRQSLRRIAAAAALAAAALAAAAAWTAGAADSADRTDRATAKAAAYIMRGESCTLGEIDAAPAAIRETVWKKWTSRAVAAASRDRNPEASARVMDFARGYADSVSEEDLTNASLSAVRAAVESGRLD